MMPNNCVYYVECDYTKAYLLLIESTYYKTTSLYYSDSIVS